MPYSVELIHENTAISWQPPEMSWFKLNTDGACQNGSRQMGVGGLIHNEDGIWIRGFMGTVDHGFPLKPIMSMLILSTESTSCVISHGVSFSDMCTEKLTRLLIVLLVWVLTLILEWKFSMNFLNLLQLFCFEIFRKLLLFVSIASSSRLVGLRHPSN